jgi:hypothetical protein
MVKSNTEDTELQALHSYNIDIKNREIFLQDKQNLKALHTGISSGAIPTNIDQTTLLLALKAAYKGQQLNDNQKKLLTQFSQQF